MKGTRVPRANIRYYINTSTTDKRFRKKSKFIVIIYSLAKYDMIKELLAPLDDVDLRIEY